MTSTSPSPADPGSAPPSDRLWLRSELMGTQVITRDSGRRLGVVGEVVVDIDRREVVALGLRDNPLTRFLPGLPRWMPLERIRQVGDVILVDSVDCLDEGFNPERYSRVINCQVISEAGAQLGRVLGFSFDVETGELTTLVIGALGVPLLGEGVLSTWELPAEEVVSSGSDRIIVYEGAEEKLKQLGSGLLEKLGIGGGLEKEQSGRLSSAAVPAENQLPAGQPSVSEQRRIQPASSRSFRPEEDYDYVELEERREREPLQRRRYLDEEEERSAAERFSDAPRREPRAEPGFEPRAWDEPEERPWPGRSERDSGWDRERAIAEEPRGRREPEAEWGREERRDGDREGERYGRPSAGAESPRRRPQPGPDRQAPQPVEVEAEVLDDPW